MLKPPVEIRYRTELDALAANDQGHRKPEGWRLSPWAVKTFVLGADKPLPLGKKKIAVERKFHGDDALVERCIVTLAGSRGLMLVGEPGTAKTMLSELFTAAISGVTTHTVQGTAGTTDEQIKYSWNYALLLAQGPVREALVPGPLYTGMSRGLITRFEEITRCPSEVQDALISVMSDQVLSIPEFGEDGFLFAQPGFNIVATANIRDKGVNEMSSALKRRFNFETVRPVNNVQLEADIITRQAEHMLGDLDPAPPVDTDVVALLACVFNELRGGESLEGARIESPQAVMSTAEAVALYQQTALDAHYYDRPLSIDTLVQNLKTTVLKESRDDLPRLKNYFDTVVKGRVGQGPLWKKFHEARKWIK